jgi:hypothetical protein
MSLSRIVWVRSRPNVSIRVVDEAMRDSGPYREGSEVSSTHWVNVAVNPGVDLDFDDVDKLFLAIFGMWPRRSGSKW